MTEQRKAVIKNADMTEEMQQDAVDIASQALAKYNIEKVRDLFDFRFNFQFGGFYLLTSVLFVSFFRTWQRISRKNSTRSTIPHGESEIELQLFCV